ncbi:condensation domain-containing protein [Actinoplanes sp. HUAS TT8]|uniref:condensation domain-containing protein n=1 Tax=Actinoplanes sp. HUAS TT8 TaxID=3447453 RepID=UPI003F524151
MLTAEPSADPRLAVVADLFAEVLELDDGGDLAPDDDFFDEGGDSLQAVRLVNAIRARFGVELSLKALFRAPTVAGLLASIESAPRTREAIVRQPRTGLIPASFAQHRLWAVDQFEAMDGVFNVPIAVRVRGPLDPDVLVAALHDVVLRHESLHTVMVDVAGVPWQQILAPAQVRVPVRRETVTPGDLPERLAGAARHAFDLSGLPIAAWLWATGPDEHVFLVVIHHIAFDDGSVRPFFEDLGQAYAARTTGRPPAFTPPPVQYADYAIWQRELLGSESDPDSVVSRQIKYWRSTLAGAPDELTLRTARPRPAKSSHHGAVTTFTIDADLRAGLTELARSTGSSLFMVVHTAFVAVLARLGGGSDIVIGAPVAGRTDAAVDDVVGFFVNTLVLRTDLSGRPDLRTLLDRVRTADLEAFEHQDIPFDRVVEALNPPRSLARHPLFQVMLTLLTEDKELLRAPGLSCAEEPIDLSFSRYDLWLGVIEPDAPRGERAGLSGEIVYNTELFDAGAIRDLTDRFVAVLRELVTDPSAPVLPVRAHRAPVTAHRRPAQPRGSEHTS